MKNASGTLYWQGMSKCGAAGLMGNIYAESGLVPTNLQNSFEKKLDIPMRLIQPL